METLVIFGLKWLVAHASAPVVTHVAAKAGTHVASEIAGDIATGHLSAAAKTTHSAFQAGSAAWKARKCKTRNCEGANLSVGDTCPYCGKTKLWKWLENL